MLLFWFLDYILRISKVLKFKRKFWFFIGKEILWEEEKDGYRWNLSYRFGDGKMEKFEFVFLDLLIYVG